MKLTHCKRIPSAQTWEPFSKSETLYALIDLLADQNCYRKIQLIWEINPCAIVILTKKGFSVRHVSIDRCPFIHFKCVLIHKKACLPNNKTYTLLYEDTKLYFSFSENDLANQSTKTGTTYVYLEVYSKVSTTSWIEAGNANIWYEAGTYF